MTIRFFSTAAELREWFATHHATAREVWVGYYKRASGRPSVTWPESVEEALCHGWIDGVRKSLDGHRYTIRFSPRRPRSIWSALNIRRAEALLAENRMRPAGLQAFEARKENRSGVYSYEQRPRDLPEPYAVMFKKNRRAWRYFQGRPPSYRRAVTWWIVSAKKEATRRKRLRTLIEDSARGRLIGPMAALNKRGTSPARARAEQ